MSKVKTTKDTTKTEEACEKIVPAMNSLSWTDYVLSHLSDDEKINGNPTTDGLRRIFETVLDCTILHINTAVVQAPSPENEKRATVVYKMEYVLNSESVQESLKHRSVTGAADVYWGNCDKIYRNHPVAVAETRAEGRSLRKGLRLRKVVAAEEIAENIEDDVDGDSVLKISSNQINFVDVMAKRIDVDIIKLIKSMDIDTSNIRSISHDSAVNIIKTLTEYQQNIANIPPSIIGYQPQWKDNI